VYDIEKRPSRHVWFETLLNVETDLYQQIYNQSHIIQNHCKAEVKHSNRCIP